MYYNELLEQRVKLSYSSTLYICIYYNELLEQTEEYYSCKFVVWDIYDIYTASCCPLLQESLWFCRTASCTLVSWSTTASLTLWNILPQALGGGSAMHMHKLIN